MPVGCSEMDVSFVCRLDSPGKSDFDADSVEPDGSSKDPEPTDVAIDASGGLIIVSSVCTRLMAGLAIGPPSSLRAGRTGKLLVWSTGGGSKGFDVEDPSDRRV